MSSRTAPEAKSQALEREFVTQEKKKRGGRGRPILDVTLTEAGVLFLETVS